MESNTFEQIFKNNAKMAILKSQLSSLEKANALLMETALLSGVSKQGEYELVCIPGSTQRKPRKAAIIAVLGRRRALEIASFTMVDAKKLYPAETVEKWFSKIDGNPRYEIRKAKEENGDAGTEKG